MPRKKAIEAGEDAAIEAAAEAAAETTIKAVEETVDGSWLFHGEVNSVAAVRNFDNYATLVVDGKTIKLNVKRGPVKIAVTQ